jgi:hypothetical protein
VNYRYEWDGRDSSVGLAPLKNFPLPYALSCAVAHGVVVVLLRFIHLALSLVE